MLILFHFVSFCFILFHFVSLFCFILFYFDFGEYNYWTHTKKSATNKCNVAVICCKWHVFFFVFFLCLFVLVFGFCLFFLQSWVVVPVLKWSLFFLFVCHVWRWNKTMKLFFSYIYVSCILRKIDWTTQTACDYRY